jgi:predicted DCC family thiol-disulfide oxidoreductase YuxK
MSEPKIIIYDSDCAYCRGFVRLLSRLDKSKQFMVIPYDEKRAQELLQKQFGKRFGFSMYLFDQQQVCWGREAASKMVSTLSLPRWLAKIAFYIYPTLVRVVSKLTGRTRHVCGPECLEKAMKGRQPLCVETNLVTRDEMSRLANLSSNHANITKPA